MSVATNLRVVFDTNNLVSALLVPQGHPALALEAWRRDEFVLVTADDLVEEVEDVISRPRIRRRIEPDAAKLLVEDLRELAVRVAPMELASLPIRCRDPDDDMVLACALGGNADVVVTGDGDLLVLDGDRRLGTLRIMRVREFLERLAETRQQSL